MIKMQKIINIIGILSLLIGTLLMICRIVNYKNTVIDNIRTVEGTVIRTAGYPNIKTDVFENTVIMPDVSGEVEYKIGSTAYSQIIALDKGYTPGTVVILYYQENKPDTVSINREPFLNMITILGLIFLMIGFVCYVVDGIIRIKM